MDWKPSLEYKAGLAFMSDITFEFKLAAFVKHDIIKLVLPPQNLRVMLIQGWTIVPESTKSPWGSVMVKYNDLNVLELYLVGTLQFNIGCEFIGDSSLIIEPTENVVFRGTFKFLQMV